MQSATYRRDLRGHADATSRRAGERKINARPRIPQKHSAPECWSPGGWLQQRSGVQTQFWSVVFIRDLLLQVNRNCRALGADASDSPDKGEVASQLGLDFHSKRQVVAIKVDHIEVAHSIVVILGWLNHVGTACAQLGVNLIDVVHEHTDAPITGQALGLTCRKQVESDFVAAQACIGCWVAVFKSDFKPERSR